MPSPMPGVKPWIGNPNPVTLVATVVARKNAVQPSSRLPAISPNRTTNPEAIATRLMATCTRVKVFRSNGMMDTSLE